MAQIKDSTGKESMTRETLTHTYHLLLQRTVQLSSAKDSCLSILKCQNSYVYELFHWHQWDCSHDRTVLLNQGLNKKEELRYVQKGLSDVNSDCLTSATCCLSCEVDNVWWTQRVRFTIRLTLRPHHRIKIYKTNSQWKRAKGQKT